MERNGMGQKDLASSVIYPHKQSWLPEVTPSSYAVTWNMKNTQHTFYSGSVFFFFFKLKTEQKQSEISRHAKSEDMFSDQKEWMSQEKQAGKLWSH